MFENVLNSCPFLSLENFIQLNWNLAFFKTEFGIFQLQAPGNPGRNIGAFHL